MKDVSPPLARSASKIGVLVKAVQHDRHRSKSRTKTEGVRISPNMMQGCGAMEAAARPLERTQGTLHDAGVVPADAYIQMHRVGNVADAVPIAVRPVRSVGAYFEQIAELSLYRTAPPPLPHHGHCCGPHQTPSHTQDVLVRHAVNKPRPSLSNCSFFPKRYTHMICHMVPECGRHSAGRVQCRRLLGSLPPRYSLSAQ